MGFKIRITKEEIKKFYTKAKPKMKRIRQISRERGMQINRDLARPIKINKMTTGI